MQPRTLGKQLFTDVDDDAESNIDDSLSQPQRASQNPSFSDSIHNQKNSDSNESPSALPAALTGATRQQFLDMLQLIQLPHQCTGWDQAFDFLLDKFDLTELAKFSVQTFDYILQDA
jgi:hypothetical protein